MVYEHLKFISGWPNHLPTYSAFEEVFVQSATALNSFRGGQPSKKQERSLHKVLGLAGPSLSLVGAYALVTPKSLYN